MSLFSLFSKWKKDIHLSAGAKGGLALLEKANLVVSGLFEGDIQIKGDLTVEKGAAIRGRVSAENVFVKGKVCGDVLALREVKLMPSAELRGDVRAASLVVQKGARFWGKSEIMHQSIKDRTETQMTPEETAQFLQIDVDTVLELAENKKIPASREDNGVWFFDRIDLERWVSENSLALSSASSVLYSTRP